MMRTNDNGKDRDMTAAEIADYEAWAAIAQAEAAARDKAEAATLAARNSALAKLKALGLTDSEVAAIVGA